MKVKLNKSIRDEVTKKKTISKERQEVEVEPVKENMKSVWVKLPDGHIIKRKRRDIVSYEDRASGEKSTEAFSVEKQEGKV